MFRSIRTVVTALAVACVVVAVPVEAFAEGPIVSMPAKSWKSTERPDGVEYTCIAASCVKGSIISAVSKPIWNNFEDEMNKPYYDVRAFTNGGARYRKVGLWEG